MSGTSSSLNDYVSVKRGRGVWMAAYREMGCPVLVAITSAGVHLAEITLLAGASWEDADATLQALLDRHDPVSAAEAA